MPFILRKIRKSKWYKNENVPWLVEPELQADALTDLSTQSNALSVWMIDDDRSNLQRVVAALSANVENVSNFDYALLDAQILIESGYKLVQIAGDTPDEDANNWHRDLTELSVNRLVDLAHFIQNRSTIERVTDKNVLRYLADSVAHNFIDKAHLKPALLNKLEKRL